MSILAADILLALKQHLKVKGIHYSDLAQRLCVAEVTIKRLMNNENIRFDQITELVEAAGLDLAELINEQKLSYTKQKVLQGQLAEFFNKWPAALQYYALCDGKKTVSELARLLEIDESSSYVYCRALEQRQLVKLEQEKPNKTEVYGIGNAESLPAMRTLLSSQLEGILQRFEALLHAPKPASNEHTLFWFWPYLTDEQFTQLINEQNKIIRRAYEVSFHNQSATDAQLRPMLVDWQPNFTAMGSIVRSLSEEEKAELLELDCALV